MKILYTASDRNDAQLAADSVRDLGQEVRVVWAGNLSDAGRWVSENRDVAGIVVDLVVQNQGFAPLVRHVRALGLSTPILVVVPEAAPLPVAVLEAGACEFVLKSQSLSNLAAVA